MYCMECYYEGQNVTNAAIINQDEVLISVQAENKNRLVVFNLETKVEQVIREPCGSLICMDFCLIPQIMDATPYYILHTGEGLELVNTEKRKTYQLA